MAQTFHLFTWLLSNATFSLGTRVHTDALFCSMRFLHCIMFETWLCVHWYHELRYTWHILYNFLLISKSEGPGWDFCDEKLESVVKVYICLGTEWCTGLLYIIWNKTLERHNKWHLTTCAFVWRGWLAYATICDKRDCFGSTLLFFFVEPIHGWSTRGIHFFFKFWKIVILIWNESVYFLKFIKLFFVLNLVL